MPKKYCCAKAHAWLQLRLDKSHQCWLHFVLTLKSDLFVFIRTKKGMCSLELFCQYQYRYECQPGVNFTNIQWAAFSYESFLCSFYVLTIWVCIIWAKGFWRKSCSLNVGEIDTCTKLNLAMAYWWQTSTNKNWATSYQYIAQGEKTTNTINTC